MRVLIVAQYYKPEDVAAAVWIPQLAEDMVAQGHHVTVLTAFPNYPKRVIFPGYRRKVYQREVINGVNVIRTWIYANPSERYWSRLANWGSFCISSLYGGLACREKVDVVYAILPPLPLGVSSLIIAKYKRAKLVTCIEDIYPLVAIQLGILRNAFLIDLFSKMERCIYRHSNALVGLSDNFLAHFRTNGAENTPMKVIPNWVDVDDISVCDRMTSYRRELGINDEFVVLYSGNLSHNSCIEDLVYAAEFFKDKPVKILIAGDGVKKEELVRYTIDHHVGNVVFIPFQPLSKYNELLATADIAVVALNSAATTASVPSKIFKHMASGRAIIGITLSGNELSRMVVEHQCGITVEPGNIRGIADAVTTMVENDHLRTKMGLNARNAVVSSYTRRICVDNIISLLQRTVNKKSFNNSKH